MEGASSQDTKKQDLVPWVGVRVVYLGTYVEKFGPDERKTAVHDCGLVAREFKTGQVLEMPLF